MLGGNYYSWKGVGWRICFGGGGGQRNLVMANRVVTTITPSHFPKLLPPSINNDGPCWVRRALHVHCISISLSALIVLENFMSLHNSFRYPTLSEDGDRLSMIVWLATRNSANKNAISQNQKALPIALAFLFAAVCVINFVHLSCCLQMNGANL